ncbi:MAG: zinc/iron-chelating domain-containing protein [Pirellulaceae bacterium]|nr:MAG: zinc/iron-chelating domain-containing protein [Pirellulaceae bacterium]
MSEQPLPWYQAGLRFTCTQCGNCCTGAPGYVWVNDREIEALAALLEMSVEEFERLYVRRVGIRKSLREFPNGDCVFFDSQTRRCTVYEQRPRQCRTWPFWDSNLRSPEAWRRTCEVCPGSGQGRLYSLEEIEIQRNIIHL